MGDKENLKKKQIRRLVVILAMLTVIMGGIIGIYNRVIIGIVERDMGEILVEAASRGQYVLQEDMTGGFEVLHAKAEQLSDADLTDATIFDSPAFKTSENAWFVVTGLDGTAVSSKGTAAQEKGVRILQEGLGKEEIVCDFASLGEMTDGIGLVLMVPIKKDGMVKGILSVFYDVASISSTMESPIEGGRQASYLITKEGKGILWDTKGENPLGITADSSFNNQAFLDSNALAKELAAAMKESEKGIIQTTNQDKNDAYISFTTSGFQDWYVVTIAQTDLIAEKAAEISRFVWMIGGLVVLIILPLAFWVISIFHKRGSSMEQEVLFDALTGLPNWKNMQILVAIPRSDYGQYACVVFHVNNFKQINAMFGFEEGGRVLKAVAQVLENTILQGEHACRISGDKFALLIRYISDAELESRLTELFRKLELLELQENKITFNYRCSFTGGVCMLKKLENEQTIQDARDRAVLVLEGMKKSAESRWDYFDENAKEELTLRQCLEKDIIRAFNEREFVPYFQPEYNIVTGEILGAEVLARWNHPERGIIMPKHFIPVLERAGLILDLDLSMLDGACRCLKNWLDQGNLPVTITVNISRLNLYRKDFVKQVRMVTSNYRIPPSLLAFEIGDDSFTEDLDKVKEVVDELKSCGFKVIMDDAGLGRVMVEVFQKVSLDFIKVNKNFILQAENGERERLVFSNLMQMTKDLDVTVIAKFVETKEEAAAISRHGCENAQGRYFAEPLAEKAFVSLLFSKNQE